MKNYISQEIKLVGIQAIYSKGELIYRDRQMIHEEIDQRQKLVSDKKK
jgi:hypothetical protein